MQIAAKLTGLYALRSEPAAISLRNLPRYRSQLIILDLGILISILRVHPRRCFFPRRLPFPFLLCMNNRTGRVTHVTTFYSVLSLSLSLFFLITYYRKILFIHFLSLHPQLSSIFLLKVLKFDSSIVGFSFIKEVCVRREIVGFISRGIRRCFVK